MRRPANASSVGSTNRSRSRLGARRRHAAGAFVLALGLLLAFASSALAVPDTYFKTGQFGQPSVGSGPGQFNLPLQVAVDNTSGDVFMVDRGNNRVQVFRPTGNSADLLTEFGGGALSNPYGIAIAPGGAVYVSDAGNERIVKFVSDGAPTPAYSIDPTFTSPPAGSCGGGTPCTGQVGNFAAPLTVDPSDGELLVGDPGNGVVDRYEADGTFVNSFDGASAPGASLAGITSVAVTDAGDVLVAHSNRVDQFAANGTHQFRLLHQATPDEQVEEFPPSFAAGTVVGFDPNTGYTLVGSGYGGGSEEVDRASVSAFDGATFVSAAHLPSEGLLHGVWGLTGIAVDSGNGPTVGTVYVGFSRIFAEAGDNGVAVLRPATAPAVSLNAPSGLTESAAHLSGSVNPNGTDTKWRFEVSADGTNWWSTPVPDGSTGSGTDPVPVAADIQPLQPNTTYHVRLIVENKIARRVTGEQTFTTAEGAPGVAMMGAAPVLETSARLNARVNPNGLATTYYFEYGPDANYGTALPAGQDGDAGDGSSQVLVARTLDGLQVGTTYHYRLVAQSAAGIAKGPDTTFKTRTAGELTFPTRGVELVSEPEKGEQSVFEAAMSSDGNRVFWGVPGGTPTATNGGNGLFLADRTASGWQSKSLVPPPDEQLNGGYQSYRLSGWSPTMDRFLVTSNQGLLAVSPYALATIDPDGRQHRLFEFESLPEAPHPSVTDDFSHVVASASQAIDPRHTSGVLHVYDFGSGSPELVDVMPDGSVSACGVEQPGWGFGEGYSRISSDDGSQVFFGTRGDKCDVKFRLYVRHRDTGTTTALSGDPVSGPEGDSYFIRATPDGDEALFHSASRLVATDGNDTNDIYRYRRGEPVECLTCIVPSANIYTAGTSPLVAASSDLKYIYFISPDVIIPGQGAQGARNLYLWHDGQIEYISPSGAGATFSLVEKTFSLSEDGTVLFFQTDVPGVTDDDNGGTNQYYRYDARSKALECVTCARGVPSTSNVTVPNNDPSHPGTSPMTADGNTFVFETKQALVRRDVNSGPDIYEWHNGAIVLVTDGTTIWPAGISTLVLWGISANGESIAFTGSAPLTGYEHDSVGQLFVARRDGGFPRPPVPPPPCAEDACQGSLQSSPSFAGPGSASVVGPGNSKDAVKKAKPKKKKAKKKKARGRKHKGQQRHAQKHANGNKRGGK